MNMFDNSAKSLGTALQPFEPAANSVYPIETVATFAQVPRRHIAVYFIILNIEATSATTISALGFAVIALGGVYWLMRERDDRSVAVRSGPVPAIKESDPD
jgi:hypothetical protein